MRKTILAIGCWLLAIGLHATEVKSPNGNIVLNFNIEDGRPTYSVNYKGRAVILPSHLGLELARDKHASMGEKERDLMDGFTLEREDTSTFDETWQPVWGETRSIRNHYNEYAATLSQQWRENVKPTRPGIHWQPRHHRREMIIRFRIYDDGVGFRYEFPSSLTSTTSLLKRNVLSLLWLATIRHGGFPVTTTPRSR